VIDCDGPGDLQIDGLPVAQLTLSAQDERTGALRDRYLGAAAQAVYLIRPDQHVAARWDSYDARALRAALRKATGKDPQ
jgi:3-(3-hydroxy-phenyl)propionate hydroxylase